MNRHPLSGFEPAPELPKYAGLPIPRLSLGTSYVPMWSRPCGGPSGNDGRNAVSGTPIEASLLVFEWLGHDVPIRIS